MNKNFARLAVLGSVLGLGACADIYEPKPRVTPIKDAWLISNTASISSTLVTTAKSGTFTCAAPPPDAAFNQGEAADVNFALLSLGGGGQQKFRRRIRIFQRNRIGGAHARRPVITRTVFPGV